jgi:hypothetical protein
MTPILYGLQILLLALLPAPAYRNPVSHDFADTFADPTIIRGQDGLWYAYATSDPLRQGEGTPHHIPTARSSDLVHWSFVGDALTGPAAPYVAPGASYWAPDVRYLDGRYVMYYAVTDTTTSPDTSDFAIGVATADSPTGPWTSSPTPVVAPRPGGGGGYLSTIDPAELTAADGTRYLYFGSYYGGVSVIPLSPDGLQAAGPPTMVAIDNKYEGSYVVHRDGYYYLFVSSANCCAGPTTGYAVSVGRSRSPLGPFLDAHGISLTASRTGGTPVVTQNGNRWIGPGHNGMITDLSGQDYLVYHAIDRSQPYLDQPYGVNRRPMLLDRLDWINGWPTVRAGAGPSDNPQPSPVTGSPASPVLRGDVRVEADLRAGAGLYVGSAQVRLTTGQPTTPPAGGHRTGGPALVVTAQGRRAAVALPPGLDYSTWHNVAVEVRGRRLTATLTEARQSGPIASVTLTLPPGPAVRRAGVISGDAANFSAVPLYRPVTRAVPPPSVGRLISADEFGGSSLGPGWSWVRQNPSATVANGTLNWPVEAGDLTGTSNSAGVLLRTAPTGDYTAETKLTLDLGENDVRNYQQAGLIAYAGDDDFARLDDVAIWNTRQIEFGREIPYAGQLSYGGTTLGTPATTTWLRLVHRIDPATGEHRFRGESSTDGRTWTLSGVWTFPAGTTPQIGLVAHGGANPPLTAQFDYFRVYR